MRICEEMVVLYCRLFVANIIFLAIVTLVDTTTTTIIAYAPFTTTTTIKERCWSSFQDEVLYHLVEEVEDCLVLSVGNYSRVLAASGSTSETFTLALGRYGAPYAANPLKIGMHSGFTYIATIEEYLQALETVEP